MKILENISDKLAGDRKWKLKTKISTYSTIESKIVKLTKISNRPNEKKNRKDFMRTIS